MQANNKFLGEKGEIIAEQFLKNLGYKIIEKNYKVKYAEIDIIAKDGNTLVFVEVRTKKDDKFGTPQETINKEKIWRLRHCFNGYLKIKNHNGSCRIDVIAILFNSFGDKNNFLKIIHYQNIIS